ncbi:sigma-70 family RNA polymerase sigma factor [Paenibacillus sp. Marseille-Q4541]|uniref:RNA polymerase sigma factor n=1 Tax=Paenibacillus sp. Marseille-Q4541 TaxID=2831522 RepID=UPI001BAB6266|nr:sigma-70 family RNA polymerase sigma factor [Paenibacillus sp. Marseille-Q4541]
MGEDSLDEHQILNEVINGNKQLYAHIVNKYKDRIYNLIIGMGVQRSDAEDLVQDTFIKAYQKLTSHDQSRSLGAWIYKIAVRLVIDHKRSNKVWLPEEKIPVRKEIHTPEEELIRSEMRSEVHTMLASLKEEERLVVLLRYTNELSYGEIAAITELSAHQVRNRLHRAKKRLKKQFGNREVRDYECLNSVQIDDRLLTGFSDEDTKHLAGCSACRELYQELKQEQILCEKQLYNARTGADFTSKVMLTLDDIEIEAEPREESKRTMRWNKGRLRKWGLAAAVVLLCTGSAVYALQQTKIGQEEVLSSSSKLDMEEWTPLQSANYGSPDYYGDMAQYPGVEVESKGITLKVSEMLVNRFQIVLAIEMKTAEREEDESAYLPRELVLEDTFQVLDADGKQVGRVVNNKAEGTVKPGITILRIPLDANITSDTLQIKSTLSQVGVKAEGGGNRIEEGNWGFIFHVDFKKAKENSVVTPLNEQVTLPNGDKIVAENYIRAPRGNRLDFVTTTEDPYQGGPFISANTNIHYLITNPDTGETYPRYEHFTDDNIKMIKRYTDEEGVHWSTFISVDDTINNMPLEFRLKGYSMPSTTWGPTKIETANLPVTFNDKYDSYTFHSIRMGKNPNGGEERVGIIDVSATLTDKPFDIHDWFIKNEKGRGYTLDYHIKKQSGTHLEIQLLLKGITEIPRKMTVKRIFSEKDLDIDWKFILPTTNSYSWLEPYIEQDTDK